MRPRTAPRRAVYPWATRGQPGLIGEKPRSWQPRNQVSWRAERRATADGGGDECDSEQTARPATDSLWDEFGVSVAGRKLRGWGVGTGLTPCGLRKFTTETRHAASERSEGAADAGMDARVFAHRNSPHDA